MRPASGWLVEPGARRTHQHGGVEVLPGGAGAQATQPSGRVSKASTSTRSVRVTTELIRPVRAAAASRTSARSMRSSWSPQPGAGDAR